MLVSHPKSSRRCVLSSTMETMWWQLVSIGIIPCLISTDQYLECLIAQSMQRLMQSIKRIGKWQIYIKCLFTFIEREAILPSRVRIVCLYYITLEYMTYRGVVSNMKFKVTFEFESGNAFTCVDHADEDYIEIGTWKYPFPNEYGNSFAFGLCEVYSQSDDFSHFFYNDTPVICKTELME